MSRGCGGIIGSETGNGFPGWAQAPHQILHRHAARDPGRGTTIVARRFTGGTVAPLQPDPGSGSHIAKSKRRKLLQFAHSLGPLTALKLSNKPNEQHNVPIYI